MNLPPTFAPIYYCEPDRSRGQIFPDIMYLDDWHATGAQHMELARILLAVHVCLCTRSWRDADSLRIPPDLRLVEGMLLE
jgi:hypothetical protein